MRTLLLLTILCAPAYADELQYTLTGDAVLFSDPQGPQSSFDASFTLNTLSGPSSFSFGGPGGTVDLYHFSGADVTNLTASVGGHTIGDHPIMSIPFTTAVGAGSTPGPPILSNFMNIGNGSFIWENFDFAAPSTLNSRDPLADLLTPPGGYGGNIVVVGEWLASFSVQVTDVSVSEPGTIGLVGLGLAALALRTRRYRYFSTR